MGGKKMEGNEEQKRARAREAHEHGKDASEVGGTTGASKQRTEASNDMSHQQKIDLKREGKHERDLHGSTDSPSGTPKVRPRSRETEESDRGDPRM